MAKEESAPQHGRRYVVDEIVEIWDNLGKHNLWKRILKNVVATTIVGETQTFNLAKKNGSLLSQSAYVLSQDPEMPLARLPTLAQLQQSLVIQADVLARWQKHSSWLSLAQF